MTDRTMCGAILDSGRDCPVPVDRDAPFNICDVHLREAHAHVESIRGLQHHVRIRCPECDMMAGITFGADAIRCRACEHVWPRPIGVPEREWLIVPSDLRPDPVVYYMQFADRVKIGTTTNLVRRRAEIAHDRLLAVEPGGIEVEAQRHAQFKALCWGGEWFYLGALLIAHIAEVRAQHGEPDA